MKGRFNLIKLKAKKGWKALYEAIFSLFHRSSSQFHSIKSDFFGVLGRPESPRTLLSGSVMVVRKDSVFRPLFLLPSYPVWGRRGKDEGVPEAFADLPEEDAIAIRLGMAEVGTQGSLGASFQAVFPVQVTEQFRWGKGGRFALEKADELGMGR
jgi:hypothetical protein